MIGGSERLDLAEKVEQFRRDASFEVLLDQLDQEVHSNHGSDAGSENSEASRRSLRTLSNLRERHTRALEALRKGSRSAAVARACQQSIGPASSSNDDFVRNTSEDPTHCLEEALLQEPMSTSLTADPLVTAVRSISQRHIHEYSKLHAKVQELREETAHHHGELCQAVQAHSDAISTMRPTKRRPCFAIFQFMAAAFGFTFGVVLGLETVTSWKLPGLGAAHAIPVPGKTIRALQKVHPPQFSVQDVFGLRAGRHPRQQFSVWHMKGGNR
mmetsp:Transcript_1352/g.2483  ORF Transcript_1352/g.2483 Transcript_1352/m.2483 type:complete len:271 (+) Transcript_1352:125-937(+)|eukprot:CAMPEP_0172830894 /NCGR_PEP_ID=MMETSP1075-20121228/22574_1 /TAXON_ID=2916 /ORGANISM="Ceratium fusus, Strain PA161109" /LENGTH=270 /DNA_ID=CAMNT_0013673255 /DNA_START=44 /DNA_END=856 /DNA_ORIENTATION=-